MQVVLTGQQQEGCNDRRAILMAHRLQLLPVKRARSVTGGVGIVPH